MSNTQMPHPPSPPLKVWLVSGAVTLAIAVLAARLIMTLWPQSSAPEVPAPDFEAQLKEKAAVIVDESSLLPEAACPTSNRRSFEALKQEGMEARAQGDFNNALLKFKVAFDQCSAPEVLIALNNARIGQNKAYTLAVAVPFSGSNPNNAIEMLRGFGQAQTQINEAGGINGVPLKLLAVDDADREEVARNLAIALTDDAAYDAVLGIAGHWTSDVSLAAAQIYRARQVLPFITPISTTIKLSNLSDWVFRITLNNRSGAQALARYMLENWRLKKAAIFYVGGVTYSEEIREEFASVVDPTNSGQIVAQFDMAAPGFDPKRSVQAAIDAGAEGLLLATNNGSLDQAIAVMKANNNRLKVLGDLANLYSQQTLQQAGEAAVGMVMAIPWDIEGQANPTFVENAKTLWHGPVNYVSAMSYNAIMAMAKAMEKNPRGASREQIKTELNSPDFAAAGASVVPIRFSNGDYQERIQLVEVVRVPGSAGKPAKLDFVPILSLPGDS